MEFIADQPQAAGGDGHTARALLDALGRGSDAEVAAALERRLEYFVAEVATMQSVLAALGAARTADLGGTMFWTRPDGQIAFCWALIELAAGKGDALAKALAAARRAGFMEAAEQAAKQNVWFITDHRPKLGDGAPLSDYQQAPMTPEALMAAKQQARADAIEHARTIAAQAARIGVAEGLV